MSNDYSFSPENNKISKDTLVGVWSDHQLEVNHLTALEKYAGHPMQNNSVTAFNRVQAGKAHPTSRNYKKGKIRMNFTVVFGMERKKSLAN